MFYFFNHQKTLMSIPNKNNEYVVLTRGGRSNTRFALNYLYKALLQDDTQLESGDLLNDGTDNYFVVALRKSYRSNQAQLYKTNSTIDIVRLVRHYVDNQMAGYIESSLYINVPCVQETITASMKQFDPGLLPSTVKKFLVLKYDIQLLDRIKLNNENYQIDSIDDTSFPGLLYLQCSIDKRIVR